MSDAYILPYEITLDYKSKQKFGLFQHSYIITGQTSYEGNAIGVDPGVNFGITIFNKGKVKVMWGKLEKQKRKGHYGIWAYNAMLYLCEFVAPTSQLINELPAVVEGAAYHSQYGQVGLEEVRFGFFLGLHHSNWDVRILPPATVRSWVFDNGTKQAGDVWPLLNHNAADSVGMALAAALIKRKEKEEFEQETRNDERRAQ